MIKRLQKAFALLLVFSLIQLSLGITLASAQATATGKLVTRANQPIKVNDIQTGSGATILSGATIETPDQIGATVGLGSLGSLDIAPNTKLQLDFNRDGTVKVMLFEGCVILRVKQGTYGEIDTSEGKVTSNDSVQKQAAALDVCNPQGAPAAIVNQGAAANAGAGAGVGSGSIASEGISSAALASLIIGGAGLAALAVIIAGRGDNVSESS